MITAQNLNTPSDNPVNPANSPSAEAWTHGFWGGPSVIVNRPEPCSLADVSSDKKLTDVPSGDSETIWDKNLTIIDDAGYVLSARRTLRLRGGGGGEDGTEAGSSYNTPSFKDKPATILIKRKRLLENDNSPDKNSPHNTEIEKYTNEVGSHISDTKAILEEMLKESKIGRRWTDLLSHQLDEILISNNRLGRASFKILGKWDEQRDELHSLQEHMKDLHSDMGVLKERLSQSKTDRDNA